MIRIAIAVLAALCFSNPAAGQTGSLDDAMRQAEQYQRQHGGAPPMGAPGMPAGAPGAGMVMGQPEKLPDPVELTPSLLTSFLGAVTGLKELGISTETEKPTTAEAYATNAQAMSILESNGFTPERFQQVAYTIGMAMAALEMVGREAEVDAARAQQEQAMEQLEGQVAPEQYELMRKQLGRANTMLDQMKDQPAGNVELVRERRKEIDAALED